MEASVLGAVEGALTSSSLSFEFRTKWSLEHILDSEFSGTRIERAVIDAFWEPRIHWPSWNGKQWQSFLLSKKGCKELCGEPCLCVCKWRAWELGYPQNDLGKHPYVHVWGGKGREARMVVENVARVIQRLVLDASRLFGYLCPNFPVGKK